MTSAFSSDGAQAIQQSVSILTAPKLTEIERLCEVYEIPKTCEFINKNNFTKVALQFPDHMLCDSVSIASKLEKETSSKVFILGDTSYGSCCVDEVAAEHVGAECIVHYGRACLSPSRRLPVMYVFGKRTVDLQKCASAFRELYPETQSHVIVLYDFTYSYVIDDFMKLLLPEYVNLVASTPYIDGLACKSLEQIPREDEHTEALPDRVVHKFGRQFVLREGHGVEDYSMFFIGQESITLTNFMMNWCKCRFCSFDPETMEGRTERVNINKTLMKRYYLIEKAKDAKVVGILVGTLGVANYLTIIDQLKVIISKAGKKSYLFAVGKLNVPKLANFLEIDVFVLVACAENSLLDSSEFYRPVVTPFEMEMACNKRREWTGEYVVDFQDLLPGSCSHVEFTPSEEDGEDDGTDVSLITGALRSASLLKPVESEASSSLVQRNKTLTLAHTSTAASFLASRSWQGLEQKLGEMPITKALEGRRGIAIAYEDEGNK